MATDLEKFCGGCAICSVSVLVLMIIFSFRSIAISEYGLNYSTISKHVYIISIFLLIIQDFKLDVYSRDIFPRGRTPLC